MGVPCSYWRGECDAKTTGHNSRAAGLRKREIERQRPGTCAVAVYYWPGDSIAPDAWLGLGGPVPRAWLQDEDGLARREMQFRWAQFDLLFIIYSISLLLLLLLLLVLLLLLLLLLLSSLLLLLLSLLFVYFHYFFLTLTPRQQH
jgi:hypothetical protein